MDAEMPEERRRFVLEGDCNNYRKELHEKLGNLELFSIDILKRHDRMESCMLDNSKGLKELKDDTKPLVEGVKELTDGFRGILILSKCVVWCAKYIAVPVAAASAFIYSWSEWLSHLGKGN